MRRILINSSGDYPDPIKAEYQNVLDILSFVVPLIVHYQLLLCKHIFK